MTPEREVSPMNEWRARMAINLIRKSKNLNTLKGKGMTWLKYGDLHQK